MIYGDNVPLLTLPLPIQVKPNCLVGLGAITNPILTNYFRMHRTIFLFSVEYVSLFSSTMCTVYRYVRFTCKVTFFVLQCKQFGIPWS